MLPGEPRVLLYSHDSYGLGHLSRTLAIARALLESLPSARLLILTGSPFSGAFRRPDRCRTVCLPPITKDRDGAYIARDSSLPAAEIHALRAAMARRTALDFKPDLFLVDHAPAGAGGELLGTLAALREELPRCRLVLGIRDIIDAPAEVRGRFLEGRAIGLLREIYEMILIYGTRETFDAVSAYGLPADVASKVRFTGYLGRRLPHGFRTTPRSVLVTTGGGEDGKDLLEAYLRDLHLVPSSLLPPSLLVAGPLLSDDEFGELACLASPFGSVRLRRFIPGLQWEMARADLIVCRAGYNTLCEALSLGRRILVLPRHRFRKEQQIRARILSGIGLVDALFEHPLPAGALLSRVLAILDGDRFPPRRLPHVLPLEGLPETVRILAGMLGVALPQDLPTTSLPDPREIPLPCASSTS